MYLNKILVEEKKIRHTYVVLRVIIMQSRGIKRDTCERKKKMDGTKTLDLFNESLPHIKLKCKCNFFSVSTESQQFQCVCQTMNRYFQPGEKGR